VAHPRLAESYTVSEDGTVYTFAIRQDAFFHNGDPVTADDVVFSFELAMASGVMAPYVGTVENVEKVGDNDVAITISQPYTPFINNVCNIFIVSKKAYTEAGDTFGSTITGEAQALTSSCRTTGTSKSNWKPSVSTIAAKRRSSTSTTPSCRTRAPG
jgi:peptide/nickel transport system substrate-binding protein